MRGLTNRTEGKRRASDSGLALARMALALIAGSLLLSGTAAAKKAHHRHTSLYWGAQIGEQLTGEAAPWDMRAVSVFEGVVGKSLSLVALSSPFADCDAGTCEFFDFPTEQMKKVRAYGALPFLNWGSQATSSDPAGATDQPAFQLSDVIAGAYDSYMREFAEEARNWGHPFFLRFNWEMNGNWFPWSESVNGNHTGESVAAWRHVHDIFASVGATNTTWVWCPNVDPESRLQDLASLYPGDDYVDWTCLDGYNWGSNSSKQTGWMSFDRVYRSTYDRITTQIAPSKPMIVGEIGSSERGGSKAAWIAEALTKVATEYTQIRGLLYFEQYDDGMDWPIETSAAATSAFASGIQSPAYTSNGYAGLATSPIPPPS
jgi:mannan endo-1,4-beta-mannosidase